MEHTEAQFLPAAEWLSLARAGKIVLFPPQFFLLTLVADFLTAAADDDDDGGGLTAAEKLQAQRERLQEFVKMGDPPWGEKCISPWPLKKEGKRLVMGLDEPGPELDGTDRRGDAERVVFVQFKGKEGTSGMEVGWRKDVVEPGLQEGDEEKYLEARRKERELSGGGDGELEQALRGRREKL